MFIGIFMPPLTIEAFYGNGWGNHGTCEPGGYGRLIGYKFGGGTNDYLFRCVDGSRSIVECFEGGSYEIVEHGNIVAQKEHSSIRELRKGDEPYEVIIRSPESPVGRRVRFTHV